MEITIQIADAVYQQILSNGKRVKGSIGLVNASEGNFNAYKPSCCGNKQKRVFRRLSHGRVSLTPERINLRLAVDLAECVDPTTAIYGDCLAAGDFVKQFV